MSLALTPLERFESYAMPEPNTGCWFWLASHDHNGYTRFTERKGMPERSGHRFAYSTLVGPVPESLKLDHLCRNRGCVNPAHLEPVTNQENILRGRLPYAERTHCPAGHPYDAENTVIVLTRRNGRTARACRTCRNARRRKAAA